MDFAILRNKLEGYLSPEKIAQIESAFKFAEKAHHGELRKSGDPYIEHPLETALILAELQLDGSSLMAALLHDVPENCGVPVSAIEAHFGAEVGRLVEGVTKLTKISEQVSGDGVAGDTQMENLRKMLVAMAEDVRVVFIKLADRLHNMRTLKALPPEKQHRIALETSEIYAPLAHRLGIWELKWQLEDLAFRYLQPTEYRQIVRMLANRRLPRESFINEVMQMLKGEFDRAHLQAEISGRPKHIFSIKQKMEKYAAIGRDFDDIHDLLAIRVIGGTVSDCYSAVGIIHNLWHPLPGEFDDYIANPKPNGYQSLHTTVMCLGTIPLEVQIRTRDMHYVNEYGVAAHWHYKEGGREDAQFESKLSWLRQLIEWHRELSGAEEFLESVKTDIFIDQVFVFTPKGEIKNLPKGATPLDMAYRVHTELGHRCIGAKVNSRLVPLTSQLKNGDVVEILTTKEARGPSRDWLSPHLSYVRTSHARTKIRQWFKKQERTENIERGRKILEKELRHLGIRLSEQEALSREFKYDSLDDFLTAIGYGGISTRQIVIKLASQQEEVPQTETVAAPTRLVQSPVRVLGQSNVLTHLALCCRPVPGDKITGYVTRSRGVTIHRQDCYNVVHEDERERLISVEWEKTDAIYPVKVRIDAWDRVGLIRDITTIVAEEKVNITSMSLVEHNDHNLSLYCTLETRGLTQLSRLLVKIERVRGVSGVSRVGDEAATRASTTT